MGRHLTLKLASVLGHTGNYLQRAIAHGIVSGVMRVVQGGNFGNGFMSTFFSTIAGGIQVGTKWVQGVFQTLVGGTASLISGGKFANGAVSAAMVFMFNDAMAADYAAKKLNTALGNIETKNVQNASSYQEIVDTRKKIDALFTAGANVVMVVSGTGEVVMLVRAGWRAGLNGGFKTVFWSGSGNLERAMDIGISLESTPIGSFANNYLNKVVTNGKLNQYMWNKLSATFANNAKGTAIKVGTFEGRTWLNIEKPILINNGVNINVIP